MGRLNLGGQAVIEGVLMRGPGFFSVAVRKPDGRISLRRRRVKVGGRLLKVPFVRGVFALYETLVMGFDALMYSAGESSGEEERMGSREMLLTVVFAILFALVLFVGLPFYVSSLLVEDGSFLFNAVDGFLRAAVFILYLAVISLIPDVRRMFQYHGAEHMAIHAYESGREVSVQEVRKFPTMHPRCGTSFILFVLVISVLVFSLVTSDSWAVKLVSRVVLLPVIAGVSYEVLKLSARYRRNLFFGLVVSPGLFLQRITTKKPSDEQIEVAIASLNDVLAAESSADSA